MAPLAAAGSAQEGPAALWTHRYAPTRASEVRRVLSCSLTPLYALISTRREVRERGEQGEGNRRERTGEKEGRNSEEKRRGKERGEGGGRDNPCLIRCPLVSLSPQLCGNSGSAAALKAWLEEWRARISAEGDSAEAAVHEAKSQGGGGSRGKASGRSAGRGGTRGSRATGRSRRALDSDSDNGDDDWFQVSSES